MNQEHPDYGIVKIGQNTEKSPGNLKRLAVFQTIEIPPANTGGNNSQGVK